MIVKIGNFFFRYRNGLFPLAYLVLFLKSPQLLRSPLLAAGVGLLVAGLGQLLRAVTIGSDAHRSDQFGWALADGYRRAVAAGFQALSFRRGGERVAVAFPVEPTAGPNGRDEQSL